MGNDVRCFFEGSGSALADNMDASLARVQQIKSDDLAVILLTIAVMRGKLDALRKVLASHPETRQEPRKYLAQFDAPKSSASGFKDGCHPSRKHGNLLTSVEGLG